MDENFALPLPPRCPDDDTVLGKKNNRSIVILKGIRTYVTVANLLMGTLSEHVSGVLTLEESHGLRNAA
jgi:hypothetical protein